ncbi:hypothetical protein BV22DRAFT_1135560 [Leucogyrophana mollusca]|uniref:Uncharacterized protein n=1 Tax=Leucogyrophana mollusca TaxID=85980 RepID=A0ACB8AWK0_9AGAM|nr:hypothetical protein BV22DRAFT_1135560 [Leucogyrophana mollusca]
MSVDDLMKDPDTKTLIEEQLESFPWWPDLHGWWRDIPSYNANAGTSDACQNFTDDAAAFFQGPSGSGDHGDEEVNEGGEGEENEDSLEGPSAVVPRAVGDTLDNGASANGSAFDHSASADGGVFDYGAGADSGAFDYDAGADGDSGTGPNYLNDANDQFEDPDEDIQMASHEPSVVPPSSRGGSVAPPASRGAPVAPPTSRGVSVALPVSRGTSVVLPASRGASIAPPSSRGALIVLPSSRGRLGSPALLRGLSGPSTLSHHTPLGSGIGRARSPSLSLDVSLPSGARSGVYSLNLPPLRTPTSGANWHTDAADEGHDSSSTGRSSCQQSDGFLGVGDDSDSGSDQAAANAMSALMFHSRKASGHTSDSNTSPNLSTSTQRTSTSAKSSKSLKHPRESTHAQATADLAANTTKAIQQFSASTSAENKRIKYNYHKTVKEAELCDSIAKREYDWKVMSAQRDHEMAMMDHRHQQAKLEIELARAKREEEEAQAKHLALERGMNAMDVDG